MQIFSDIEQGTDEWRRARAGLPTASEFTNVCAKKGPRGGIPKTRQTYMWKLAGEILTGEPMESYSNWHMERGKEREAEARNLYALIEGVTPEQVGFIRNGDSGCSPDGLVGNDGMVEIKDRLPHIQIEALLADAVPDDCVFQCEGQILIAEREWVDYVSHCRNMPLFIKRIYRDEKRLKELQKDIDQFNNELNELVEKIRAM